MIRAAREKEAAVLSRLSFESKRYWDYPEEYFAIWENELRVSHNYIKNNILFVYEERGQVIAYYSIVRVEEDMEVSGIAIAKGHWLDHMFVSPASIGSGIGRQMFAHLHKWCQLKAVSNIYILADPNAKGFYEKMGCQYLREHPSTIPGRTTPLLLLHIPSSWL